MEDVVIVSILLAGVGVGIFLAMKTDLSQSSYVPTALILSALGLEACFVASILALHYFKSDILLHAAMYAASLWVAVFVASFTAGVTILVNPRKATRRCGFALVACGLSPIPLTLVTGLAIRWLAAVR